MVGTLMPMTTWKTTAARNVRRLTPAEACAKLDAIRARGVTIFVPEIKELTGGYISQNINFYVTRLLAIRCGMLKAA